MNISSRNSRELDMSNLFMLHNGQLLPVTNASELSSLPFPFQQNHSTVTIGPDSPPKLESKPLTTTGTTVAEMLNGMANSGTSANFTPGLGGKCQYCPKKFNTQIQLNDHLEICRLSRPFDCSYCGKRFKVKGGLQQHEKIHMDDRQWKCRFCPKSFIQKAHVDQHERRIHTVDTLGIEANGSNEPTPTKRRGRPRNDNSVKTEAFSTASSDTGSASGSNLNSSVDGNSSNCNIGPNGLLKCPYCPQWGNGENELEIHVEECRGMRTYQCDICGKRFRERKGLTQHENIHLGIKPYQCRFCEKCFTQLSHVNRHERTHANGLFVSK